MAAFDRTKQKQARVIGLNIEFGNNVTIAGVSGQTFTVATKLKKVLFGHGCMLKDGITAVASTGAPSSGQVTFTRRGPISTASGTATGTSPDTIDYILCGY